MLLLIGHPLARNHCQPLFLLTKFLLTRLLRNQFRLHSAGSCTEPAAVHDVVTAGVESASHCSRYGNRS